MQSFIISSRNCGRTFQSAKEVYAKNLLKNLETLIKGDIHCVLHDEDLTVRIYGANGTAFYYKITDIFTYILQGISSEIVAHEVSKKYRKYITNLYFL